MREEGEAQRTNAGDRLVASRLPMHICTRSKLYADSQQCTQNTLMFVRFFTLIRYVTKACLKLRPKL
jgi:hypothetical protein